MKTIGYFTLICLTTIVFHKAFAQECSESNEHVYNGHCYTINLNTSNVVVNEAISACKRRNATLADIRNQNEQNFISEKVGELVTGDVAIWIDGQAAFTNWHWVRDSIPLGIQGCFKVGKHKPLFQAHPKVFSPLECANECLKWYQTGYIYLKPISNRLFCYCAHDLKRQAGRYSEDCTTPCDDGNYTCGGPDAMNIYSINGTYSNWIDAGHGDEAVYATPCVMMDGLVDYRWVRVPCYQQHAYICEYEMESCPSKGVTVAEKCITISQTNETWFRARYDCIQNSGDLVSIATEQVQTDLMTYLTGLNRTFWIGATSFKWKLKNDTLIFTDWGQGQPNPESEQGVYTQLYSEEGSPDLKWQLEHGVFVGKYICKRAIEGTDQPGTTPALPSPHSLPGSTATIIPHGTTEENDPNALQQDDIPVVKIVIVAVIILVLSVIVAICIIVIKKRRQRPDLYSDTDKLSTVSDIEDFTNPMNHVNHGYDNVTTTTTPNTVSPTADAKPVKAAKMDGMKYEKQKEKVQTLYRTASGRPVNRTSTGDTIEPESSGLPAMDEDYLDPNEASLRTNPSNKSRESRSSFANPFYQGWGETDDEHYETPNEPIMTKVFDFTGSMKSKGPSADGETPGLSVVKVRPGTSPSREARKLESVPDRPAQPLPGDEPAGDSVYSLEGDSLPKVPSTDDKTIKEINDENIYEDPDDHYPDEYSYTYMQFQPKK